ncbi:MAG: hypothetical protein ACP5JP_07060 [bacterium]
MNEKIFDVTIITEGLNGLLIAYELSKAGVSINLIDNYKPSFEIDGYIFDTYPGYIFSYAGLPNVFRQLNIPFETYINPVLQLILPDRRIDIYSNVHRCIAEIRRRFNTLATDIVEYILKEQAIINLLETLKLFESPDSHALNPIIKRLYTRHLLAREGRNMSKTYRKLLSDNTTSVFIQALQTHAFPWYNERKPLQGIPAILQKRFYPVGGIGAIKNVIIDKIRKQNVNVVQNKVITNIAHEKHFTISLDHKELINSKFVVAEPLYENSLSLISKYMHTQIEKNFYVDNVFIGIHRMCLPEVYNRVNYAILISDYKNPLFNDNLIFMFNNPISDIKRAKDEMTALTISYLIPGDSITRLSSIREAVINHIKHFMPFFDDYAEKIYFTEPYILWNNTHVPLNKRGVWLLNDEFIKNYTYDKKYAYIENTAKKIISRL